MALRTEAGAQRDLGKRQLGPLQQSTCSFQPHLTVKRSGVIPVSCLNTRAKWNVLSPTWSASSGDGEMRAETDSFGGTTEASKRILFPNTIKYIFVFKEGINHGSWFRSKNIVLTEAAVGTPERLTPGRWASVLENQSFTGCQDSRHLLKRALIGFLERFFGSRSLAFHPIAHSTRPASWLLDSDS
jgi:hypothetical protein